MPGFHRCVRQSGHDLPRETMFATAQSFLQVEPSGRQWKGWMLLLDGIHTPGVSYPLAGLLLGPNC